MVPLPSSFSLPSWKNRFPERAQLWKLPTRTLRFERRPLLMGIVNVTPDSFSDGGRHFTTEAAVSHALSLAAAGADLIDVGGESTRPYSEPVAANAEVDRVVPVIQALRARLDIPISIDTSKASVAQASLACGAEIINDVTAAEGDPRMIDVANQFQAAVCIMHMQGTPQTMQDNPTYEDVVAEVLDYLRHRRDSLVEAGIEPSRIAIDPGIGFGKSHQHNLTLLANCHRLHQLASPVLVGHSRKGFIGKLFDDNTADRTPGDIGVAIALANQAIQVLRVHDVASIRRALVVYEACQELEGQP